MLPDERKAPHAPGFRNTVSLDVLASQHVAGATRFPLMTLSTLDGSPLSYTPTGAAIPALSTPSQIYARMFLAGSQGDVDKELARLKRGKSMLDRMRERLGQLEKSVSHHDRQQIADYTEAVRNLEKQMVAEEAWVKRPKPTVTEPAPNENYPSPFANRSDSIGRAKCCFNWPNWRSKRIRRESFRFSFEAWTRSRRSTASTRGIMV